MVILVAQDDVMGNHGATIGHIKADQLFYLESRGLSPEQAEQMFVTASLEDVSKRHERMWRVRAYPL